MRSQITADVRTAARRHLPALLLAALAGLFGGRTLAADAWIKFADPLGNFTVEFPMLPRAVSASGPTLTGAMVPTVTYGFGAMALTDAAVLLQQDLADKYKPEEFAELRAKELTRAATRVGATLQSDMPEIVDGRPGRRVSLLQTDGYVTTYRIFYIGGHEYELMTRNLARAKGQLTADLDRFSRSLHFTAR